MEVAEFEASICDPCTACKGHGILDFNGGKVSGKVMHQHQVLRMECLLCGGTGLDRDRTNNTMTQMWSAAYSAYCRQGSNDPKP